MTDDLFLFQINHEIRPPINAIIDMAERLSRTSLDAVQNECVQSIANASDSLRRIVGDIGNMHGSTAESGPKEQPYEFCALISSLLIVASSLAHNKGLDFIASLAPDIPADLIGDALRLKRTLLGLLDNAVQHATTGHVKFEVTAKRESSQHVLLYFRIEDSDIGLRSSFRVQQRCASDNIIAPLPNPEAYRVLLLASGLRGTAYRDMFTAMNAAVAQCTAADRAGVLLGGNFTQVFFEYDAFHEVVAQHAPTATRRVAILSTANGTAPDPSRFDAFVFAPPLISEIAEKLRGDS